jgi:hypothetical protein
MCARTHRLPHFGNCRECDKFKKIYPNSRYGKNICSSCYSKFYAQDVNTHEICIRCKIKKRVSTRIPVEGKHGLFPICNNCYDKESIKLVTCSLCGALTWAHSNDPDNEDEEKKAPICTNCYNKDFRRFEECINCHLVKQVCTRNDKGEPTCRNCYTKNYQKDVSTYEECFQCHELRSVYTRTESGKPICWKCYRKHPRQIERCKYR